MPTSRGETPRAAGYSGKPLVQKLGLKEGMVCAFHDLPENYWRLMGGRPRGLKVENVSRRGLDFVHIFIRVRKELPGLLEAMRTRISPSGMIWVSWPKKASRVSSDLSEDLIRDAALSAGLVDVKVCAVDEVWSGLKLMIPRADRW
jgi:hypothetical protein